MANKTVIDLLEDFSFRHAKIDQENERRMKSDAQIMGLEEQKRALLAEKLKRAFLAEDATGFDAEIMELERRQEEIARKKGLMVPYACAACRDTGLVGRKYCTCFLREVYQTIYGDVYKRQVSCVAMHRAHRDHLPNCFHDMVNERLLSLSSLTEHSIAGKLK